PAGLLATPANASPSFSNLRLHETSHGAVLAGTISLPRGLTPTAAAHVDVFGADGSVIASQTLPSAHPPSTGYRQRPVAVAPRAGFVPVRLALHHGVHP